MEKVTYKGEKGFYDDKTGFVPLSSFEKVTYEGKRGYYNEKFGFISIDGDVSTTQSQPVMSSESKIQSMPQQSTDTVPEWGRKNPTLYGIAGAAYETASPLLEALGLVGGGIVGSGAGPLGTVAGASGGYATAKRLKKAVGTALGLEQPETIPESFMQTGKDVATGAGMEMGGQVLGKAIGGATQLAGRAYKAGKGIFASPEAQAGKVLTEERATGEPFLSNVKQAEKIQDEIPNLELTYGQKSDFPAAVRAEATTARKDNLGALLFKKYEAGNQAALRAYIKNKFPEQENIDDVINVIKPQLEKLRATQKLTQDTVDNLIADMPSVTREAIQQAGNTLRGMLENAKLETWKQAQKLYQNIDDVPIESTGILNQLKEYEASVIARGESPSVFPSNIIKQLENNAETKNMLATEKVEGQPLFNQIQVSNFNQLRGLRGQAYKLASETSDYQLANNARQIGKIIDEGMEEEAKKIGGDIWKNFRNAQDFYNNEYVGKFRLGTVGNVLKAGKDATSRYAKTDSEVIGEFFRGDKKGLERIDNLVNALGKDKVQGLVRDYAIYDLKNSVLNKATGEVIPNKLAMWYAKHKEILNKAGIGNEFENIANAQKAADAASLYATEFEKSIAGKMLGVDPAYAIQTAFAGRAGKDSAVKAVELLNMLKGDKAAIRGLQNSFKDFLMTQIENTAKDVAGGKMLSSAKADKVISQYMPAIRVLWRGEPEKIKALNVFNEAVNILNRTKTSQFAGSQTTEYAQSMRTLERLPFMGYQGVIFRFLIKLKDFMTGQQVNDVLTKARFDPNYADHLIRIAKQVDSARNFEAIKRAMERIESLTGLESGISGGKSEALGRAMGAYGVKQLSETEGQ